MDFKISYVVSGNGTNYQPAAFSYISGGGISASVKSAAQVLGISAMAIAGAMAEEANAYYEHAWQDNALDKYAKSSITVGSLAGAEFWLALKAGPVPTKLWLETYSAELQISRKHSDWSSDYASCNGDTDSSLYLKVTHPVLMDVGPANFKIWTAIRLIKTYGNTAQGLSLGIDRYIENYQLLVTDLVDVTSDLTAKLYGLYIKEAEEWFKKKNAYGSDWSALPQEFKDALYISYTNVGQAKMEELWKKRTNNGTFSYEPMPLADTGGGVSHLMNASKVAACLGDAAGYGDGIHKISISSVVDAAKASDSKGLAWRYALEKLRFAAFDGLAPNLNGELNIYNPSTGQGELTEQWINDRAEMLFLKGLFNKGDVSYTTPFNLVGGMLPVPVSGDYVYQDIASGVTLNIDGINPLDTASHKIGFGGSGNDMLWGGDLADHLYGGAGMDRLDGAKGDDYIEGNAGSDILTGGEGEDTLLGGAGTDILEGGKGNDTLQGGLGFDTYVFKSGDGWDWIEDSDGSGKITYDDGLTLTGGKAVGDSGMVWQQTLSGKVFTYILTDWTDNGKTFKRLSIQGPDGGMFVKNWKPGNLGLVLQGTEPAPSVSPIFIKAGAQGTLYGGDAQNNLIVGGAGSDVILGGRGQDVLKGGAGTDFIFGDTSVLSAKDDWSAAAPVAQDDPNFYVYDFKNWETMSADGTIVPDPKHPGYWSYELAEVGENDQLYGGAGTDYMHGGAGNDFMDGGDDGDHMFGGFGNDILLGGAANDTLAGGFGKDYLNGGEGNDLLDGEDSDSRETAADADELDGGAGNDTLRGMGGDDKLFGGTGNDELLGDFSNDPLAMQGRDWLDGGDGDDTLVGMGNADTLYGGMGRDSLFGDAADNVLESQLGDYLDGGAGDDELNGAGGGDTLYGGEGNDELYGDGSNTPLLAQGDDYLNGGTGNDTLSGLGGADTLDGGEGNDALYGDDSSDVLSGGAGNDALNGGLGNDVLDGGAGADTLLGGVGDDIYLNVDSSDILSDVEGNNRIRFEFASALKSATVTSTGNTLLTLDDDSGVVLQGVWYSQGTTQVSFQDDSTVDLEAYLGAHFMTPLVVTVDRESGGRVFGGAGNDAVNGAAGNDTLLGYSGNDTLSGSTGADTLDGGAGNDFLMGGTGADVYVFSVGSGQDTISNVDGDALGVNADTIRLGAGIAPGDVTLQRAGTDLILKLNGKSDQLTIQQYFYQDASTGFAVENIKFQDNTIWSVATVKAKVLQGTAGNDTLQGYSSNDTVNAGAGNDWGSGYAGNDSLSGGEGVDTLYGGEGNDVLDGGSGTDSLFGDVGNDTLRGGAEADYLQGGEGNDLLQGNDGSDSIMGSDGADALDGGSGNDTLSGGRGADVYLFGRGSGQDVIDNYDTDVLGVNADTIQLGSGVAVADVAVSRSNYDLLIQIKGTGDSLKVSDYFIQDAGDARAVENIRFFDGTTWNIGTVKTKVLTGSASNDTILGYSSNDSLVGGDGNDSLYGYGGADTLNGGAGNDEMSGGNGADVYVFERGSGKDVITNADSDAFGVNPDRIQLGAGISEADVNVIRSGSNLVLSIKNTQDTLTVNNYFDGGASSPAAIESIRFFNGVIWNSGIIKTRLLLGTVSNDNILGYDGNDVIDGDLGDDSINAGAGDDILDGGLGNDTLSGGFGADVYLFYRGAGKDKILNEDGVPDKIDTIKVASGIRPADVVLGRNGKDLFISIVGESDQLTATGYFGGNQASVVENIVFADGTVWDFAYVKSRAAYRGLESNDTLWGSSENELLIGADGDDSLNAGSGNDTLLGSGGNDTLQGGNGGDLYVFAPGDGRDIIDNLDGDGLNANPDVLEFDAGISESNLRFARVSDDLVVSIYGTLDQVTVSRFFDATNPARMIDKVRIKGGKEWSANDLKKLVLVGGNGADHLNGYTGNDSLFGADGRDWMVGNAGDDVLNGDAGGDYLYGGGGNDRLDGGIGDDDLHGEEGNDSLVGGVGNDDLHSEDGNDVLEGGKGNDSLNGGQGQDIYLFNKGDGWDQIYNWDTDAADAPVDIIKLGPGIAPADVLLRKDGERLVIGFKNSNDQLTVLDYYNSWSDIFNKTSELQIQFTDYSTVWSNSYIATIAPPIITLGTAQADYLHFYDSAARTVSGMAGDDSIYGNDGADTLNGDAGEDYLCASSGNDVIHGGSFGDILLGDEGSDFLYGDANNDHLFGGIGNDTLDGGAGNDELRGEAGADVYVFGIGSGQDTLYNDDADSVGVNPDTIKIGSGLLAQDVVFVNTGSDLIVKIKNSNDSLCVKNYFVSNGASSNVVENIQFTKNASVLGYSSIKSAAVFVDSSESNKVNGTGLNDTLKGTSGSDHLEGFDGNDTLIGGAGNDKLDGSLGNDTYSFSRGFGNDTILALDNTPGKKDEIKFDATFSPSNLIVKRTGDALLIAFNNSQDSILVWDFFKGDANAGFQIEGIRFSDASNTVWSKSDILSKVLACSDDVDNISAFGTNDTISGGGGGDSLNGGGGNDRIDGGAGRDFLDGGYGSDFLTGGDGIDSLNGCANLIYDNVAGKYIVDAGVDTLDGGAGDDYLYCDNDDVIRFGYGYGDDQFVTNVNAGQTISRVIELGDGVLPENVVLRRNALALDSGEVLSRTIYYSTDQDWLDFASAIKFKNGTVWGAAKIREILTKGVDGVGDDICGLSGNDSITGLKGDDTIYGADGNDSLDGGIGEDSLDGGNGNDSLLGGSENDRLDGGGGSDTLLGQAGDDYLIAGGEFSSLNLSSLVVYAKGTLCDGVAPTMEIWLDGNKVQSFVVSATAFTPYTVTLPNNAIAKEVSIVFTNDAINSVAKQNRDLFVDKIVVNGRSINGNSVGTIFDYGTGNAARDDFNTYAGNGSLGSNGALRFSLLGADYLDGGVGVDTMLGNVGNDVYVVENAADVIYEGAGGGHDIVKSSVSYTLADNVEDINLTGTAGINAFGNAGQNMLVGNSGNNRLDGNGGRDLMSALQGDDTYVVDSADDVTWEIAGAGTDTVESSINWTLQANTEVLKLTGTGNLNGTGNTLNNLLHGNIGANLLNGGAGSDVLEGGDGNDSLTDVSGAALFNGGAGSDSLSGGASAEIFLGGLGNDTYVTGAGNDVILFNKRDGQDVFASGGTGSDTLSLGGGIAYSDLSFSKSSNDLVLRVGISDQITFKDWYAATPSKPVAKLQVMAEAMTGFVQGGSDVLKNQKVENFNFAGLVGAFDAARTANPSLSTWALTNALSNFQLAGSDTAALGGDLAYQYGRNNTLSGIGMTSAINVLSDANLGTNAQTLSSLSSLQAGPVRLS